MEKRVDEFYVQGERKAAQVHCSTARHGTPEMGGYGGGVGCTHCTRGKQGNL